MASDGAAGRGYKLQIQDDIEKGCHFCASGKDKNKEKPKPRPARFCPGCGQAFHDKCLDKRGWSKNVCCVCSKTCCCVSECNVPDHDVSAHCDIFKRREKKKAEEAAAASTPNVNAKKSKKEKKKAEEAAAASTPNVNAKKSNAKRKKKDKEARMDTDVETVGQIKEPAVSQQTPDRRCPLILKIPFPEETPRSNESPPLSPDVMETVPGQRASRPSQPMGPRNLIDFTKPDGSSSLIVIGQPAIEEGDDNNLMEERFNSWLNEIKTDRARLSRDNAKLRREVERLTVDKTLLQTLWNQKDEAISRIFADHGTLPAEKHVEIQKLSQLTETLFRERIIDNKMFLAKKAPENPFLVTALKSIQEVMGKRKILDIFHNFSLPNLKNPVQKRRIADDDPRLALRTQFGVFATESIHENQVIGVYGGKLYTTEEHGSLLNDATEAKIQAYVHEIEYRIDGNIAVALDASEYRNDLAFVNDSRQDPINNPKSDVEIAPANVLFVEVVLSNWPYLFMVAKENIEVDQELLANYGPSYWLPMRELLARKEKHQELINSVDVVRKKFNDRVNLK